jgi:ubiquinone/menaquinone biosynthesis C-methylase UbiE
MSTPSSAASTIQFPVDRFDAVLIHNAYHEMTEHAAMLHHIHAALKRGGRLVIVESVRFVLDVAVTVAKTGE